MEWTVGKHSWKHSIEKLGLLLQKLGLPLQKKIMIFFNDLPLQELGFLKFTVKTYIPWWKKFLQVKK